MNLVWEFFLIACQLIADAVHYCGVMNSKWFKGSEYGNEASVRTGSCTCCLVFLGTVFGIPLGQNLCTANNSLSFISKWTSIMCGSIEITMFVYGYVCVCVYRLCIEVT